MTKRSCAEEEEANHQFHAVDDIVFYNTEVLLRQLQYYYNLSLP